MSVVSRFVPLLSFALACTQVDAAGTLTVSFQSPEKFTDFGRLPTDVDSNAKAFEQMLAGVGERHLRDGQTLGIEVLDIDLAGTLAPGPSTGQVRIVDPSDWTRMHFRFRLRDGDAAPISGDEWVDTQGQLWREGGEPFSNERRALERWFLARFGGK